MSRSFRKAGVIGYYSGTKTGRSYYHHAHRRIEHLILKECEKVYCDCSLDEEIKQSPEETFSRTKINHSVKNSTRLNWLNWGRQELIWNEIFNHEIYTGENLNYICKKFNSEVFGLYVERSCKDNRTIDIWERYLEAKKKRYLYNNSFVDLILKYNLPNRNFDNRLELLSWLSKNQKKLISTYIKLNYRR